MKNAIIWLHEKALSTNHPVFNGSCKSTRIIHIWDNGYLKKRNYSLKRLVFLYETLCSLPVQIIEGDTLEVLQSFEVEQILIPQTPDSYIREIVETLSIRKATLEVPGTIFSATGLDEKMGRFFKYWKVAKKKAFLKDGMYPKE